LNLFNTILLQLFHKEFKKRSKILFAPSRHPKQYLTENGIQFTFFEQGLFSKDRLYFRAGSWLSMKHSNESPFLSPILTMAELSSILKSRLSDIIQNDLVSLLEANNPSCQLSLVYNFNIISDSQGIPNMSLVCCNQVGRTSGDKTDTYSRFDWVKCNSNIDRGILYHII